MMKLIACAALGAMALSIGTGLLASATTQAVTRYRAWRAAAQKKEA